MTKGLDEILSGNAPTQVENPTPVKEPATEPASSEPASQPRGEHGHFAPKEPKEPEPAPQQQAQPPAPEPPPQVDKTPKASPPPPGVLQEREKRRQAEERNVDLERQLGEVNAKLDRLVGQQRQPAPQPAPEPPKPIDFWDSPKDFVGQAVAPVMEELAQTRFELSLQSAVTKYGAETVEAAETALREAIQSGQLDGETVKAQLSKSRSPVTDIVTWHQNSPAVREATLREQIRAELMAEMGQSQQPGTDLVTQPQPAAQQPQQVMPSNLARARNVGSRSGPAWSGPASLNDIFDRSRTAKAR